MYFVKKNILVFPIPISKQKFEDHKDLLRINDTNKSHYVHIKDFRRFMFNKTKHKNKKHFCWHCLQFLSSEKVLQKNGEICLKINGKQSAKLKRCSINFQNFFKQLSLVNFMLILDVI